MGLLDDVLDAGAALLGIDIKGEEKPKSIRPPDYKDGFIITELDSENGFKVVQRIQLIGFLKPMIPFVTGGTQNITKDYYPGNPEPAIQVLGPQEKDVTIRGKFKAKKVQDTTQRNLPVRLRDEIDGVRFRGSIVRIELGEWVRHAVITDTKWDTAHEAEVMYEITFSIISFANTPTVSPVLQAGKLIPLETKNNLEASLAALSGDLEANPLPAEVPATVAGFINNLTSAIAEAVNVPLNFVDNIISQAEDITDSITRAVGVVKKAKADVSSFRRRLGRVSYGLHTATGIAPNNAKLILGLEQAPPAARYTAAKITANRISICGDMVSFLAKMQSQFEGIKKTIPLARHKVRDGETLQRIANQYYNNAQQWKAIYDHNSLESTNITAGAILEIPRV